MPFTDGRVTPHDAQAYENSEIVPPAPTGFKDENIAVFVAHFGQVWDELTALQRDPDPKVRDAAFAKVRELQSEVNLISGRVRDGLQSVTRLA